jgi:hypothetical protein
MSDNQIEKLESEAYRLICNMTIFKKQLNDVQNEIYRLKQKQESEAKKNAIKPKNTSK